MASSLTLTLLSNKAKSIRKTQLLSTFHLIPNISSSSPFTTTLLNLNPNPNHNRHNQQKHHSRSPPVPKKVPFTVKAHGLSWEDPYHWMSKISDPDFVNYLSQENEYAEAFMADTQTLQQTLFSEMKSRMPSRITTPPERWGPWLYYQYIPEGKEGPVYCRKLATDNQSWVKNIVKYARGGTVKEEVLLDWNEIGEQYGHAYIGKCRVSPDHRFLAYTLDVTGSERFILQVKDLQSGSLVPRFRVDGVVSLAWAQDGSTLFYTLADENQRPYRVQYTSLGSDPVDEVTVYTENEPSFCVDITSTKDCKFITVNSNSRTSSEVYIIDATNLKDGLHRFHKRIPGVQCFLEHHRGFFYILTNAPLCGKEQLPNGSCYLARCRVEDRKLGNWQRIVIPSKGASLADMDIFDEHLVLFLNSETAGMICSINMPIDSNLKKEMKIDDLNPWYFPLPSNIGSVVPGSNHDFRSSVYRAVVSSPQMPDLIVDYDMSRKTFSIVQKEEVVGISANAGSSAPTYEREISHHLSNQGDKDKDVENDESLGWKNISDSYSCETKEVISHDGVEIPLTILYSNKTHQKGKSLGILEGYGAYADVLDKSWSSDRLSLLDRGWVFAFADVRGGAGVDPSWHKSGSGLHKSNSIYDFVSCADYLINEGYVDKCRLAAVGSSAGSILVGAAINMYPELFQAAILKVPFLDVCNTLMDPSLPLTLLDYEEFGNPQTQSQFHSILKYSPYDNIPQGVCSPAMLVTASYHDSRVGVWEAAKWVAKVRDSTCSNCSRSVILKTNMSGGHFGDGGRFGQCKETSYEYAFLMKIMGNSK